MESAVAFSKKIIYISGGGLRPPRAHYIWIPGRGIYIDSHGIVRRTQEQPYFSFEDQKKQFAGLEPDLLEECLDDPAPCEVLIEPAIGDKAMEVLAVQDRLEAAQKDLDNLQNTLAGLCPSLRDKQDIFMHK